MNYTNIQKGLTDEEVAERISRGQYNNRASVKTRSIPRIIHDNFFTLFNLVNVILALLVAFTGSYRNMLFMGTILCNIAIGIIQEVRSKLAIDRLTLISAPKAHVRRNDTEIALDISQVVMDDILLLASGRQICADCVLTDGSCEVDESLLTGESDPVHKNIGDELLSGSFVVSGSGTARVIRVGAMSYVNKLTDGAKYEKRSHSEMTQSIDKIINTVSVCIVPFSLGLFFKAIFVTQQEPGRGIVSTVAALIGMIPEGLVLLTSVALAVSSVRLAKKNTLCQDLYCIETLARVDVLCLDKTGTLTSGCMQVDELIKIDSSFDSEAALNALASSLADPNPTFAAICDSFNRGTSLQCISTVPFSSARKWSSAYFGENGTYVLGAPDFVLESDKYQMISEDIRKHTSIGKRVLLLAHSPYAAEGDALPKNVMPKVLLVLSDKIRSTAPETLAYFSEQGVCVKVISGDDPLTVSGVAQRAGLCNADSYIDASILNDDDIPAAAEKYTVFGRVSPQQKQLIVKALKQAGHRVAMTGDGVNDVLALKEADCSIAMQSGSDAARNVSQLVLVDSDFSSMPHIVAEGRRCINNIQRSASLFLGKTVFSFVLAVLFILLPFAYPFSPIQMTLISVITIGIPSFLMALEPNHEIVKGGFIGNVLLRAFPCGLAVTTAIISLMVYQHVSSISQEHFSTMATLITGAICFGSLFLISRPLNTLRSIMLLVLAAMFCGGCLLFSDIFYLTPLDTHEWTALLIILLICGAVLLTITAISRRLSIKRKEMNIPSRLKAAAAALVFVTSALFAVWFGIIMADYIALANDMEPLVASEISEGCYDGLFYTINNGEIIISDHRVHPSDIKRGAE